MSIITKEERRYLFDEITKLLYEYDYDWSTEAINRIIDTWAVEKRGLIEAFKRHKNYIDGKFMIAFDRDYDRAVNKDASFDFSTYILKVAESMRDTMPDEIKERRIRDDTWCLPNGLWNFFEYLPSFANRTLTEGAANILEEEVPEIRPRVVEKTSRVVNRLCTYLGYNKHPDYNREFAKYADSLSPLTIKRHTVLSINPLDYLTMSFGNSWASCHTIDKTNKREMPNSYSGMYSSGTVSYMLDPSSMVFYTVDASYDGDEYYTQPKINRQMFHWGEDKLVQGRLYPQSNDQNGEAYIPYRNIVQEIMATIFDFPNLWSLHKGTEHSAKYIDSYGTHYRDYECFDSCTLSVIKGSTNENRICVGHDPICIQCGREHEVEDNINCCRNCVCQDCDCVVNREDAIEIDGEYYCRDCCSYCNHCEEYHRGGSTYVRNVGWVCNDCLENHYRYCDECREWCYIDDVRYVDSTDRYVCNYCLDNEYFICEECEEYYPNDCRNEGNDGRELCDRCYEEEENEDE